MSEAPKTLNASFLSKLTKSFAKEDVNLDASPPRYWFSSGSYLFNRIMSGSVHNCIPQGRVLGLAGPSGAGKSFMACNAIREAQSQGAFIVVLDSENAIDDEFASKIGVDVDPSKYMYVGVSRISQTIKVLSEFISSYREEYASDLINAPKVVILIDSLNMLMTESEFENWKKGDQKGDQGQKNKQLKSMLQSFVHAIKELNISIIVTCQVYKNQDIYAGEPWVVADGVRFALSFIALLTKSKRKMEAMDSAASNSDDRFNGVVIRAEGFKTRFTSPFKAVRLDVPYEEGMDPLSGVREFATTNGLITKAGAYVKFTPKAIDLVPELPDNNLRWNDLIINHKDQLIEVISKLEEIEMSKDLEWTKESVEEVEKESGIRTYSVSS